MSDVPSPQPGAVPFSNVSVSATPAASGTAIVSTPVNPLALGRSPFETDSHWQNIVMACPPTPNVQPCRVQHDDAVDGVLFPIVFTSVAAWRSAERLYWRYADSPISASAQPSQNTGSSPST